MNNYAETDPKTGRKFLTFPGGGRSYFPARVPKTIKFQINEKDPSDQYARLYDKRIIDIINPNAEIIESLRDLNLPSGVDITIKI